VGQECVERLHDKRAPAPGHRGARGEARPVGRDRSPIENSGKAGRRSPLGKERGIRSQKLMAVDRGGANRDVEVLTELDVKKCGGTCQIRRLKRGRGEENWNSKS